MVELTELALLGHVLRPQTESYGVPWRTISLMALFFITVGTFYAVERMGPKVIEDPHHSLTPRGWFSDFTAALIHGPVLGAFTEILCLWCVIHIPDLWTNAPLETWPFWAAFLIYFLVNDFGRYWLHRWYHESDLLWRLHRVHHTAETMSVMTNFRLHLLEALPKYVVLVIPFKLLGISTWVLVLYSVIDLIKGAWHHANVRTYIGKANYVINSGELHWWHHSTEARGQLANYGSTLSVWDVLFGTFYWPRGKWPEKIGVAGIRESDFPADYLGRMLSMTKADGDFSPDEAAKHGLPTSAPGPQPDLAQAPDSDLAHGLLPPEAEPAADSVHAGDSPLPEQRQPSLLGLDALSPAQSPAR